MTPTPSPDAAPEGQSPALPLLKPKQPSLVSILRARLFAGMVILVPLGITLLMTYKIGEFLYTRFQGLLKPNIKVLADTNPLLSRLLASDALLSVVVVLLSILIICAVIYLVGLLSTVFITKRILGLGEKLIARIPVVSFLYNILKQIMDTIALQRENAEKLQRVVIIEYPRRGMYALAFATGETVVANTGQRYINLFLPTTPNPTSGFLLLLAPDQVFDTNLTMEQGVRFIVSGGILQPENLHQRAAGMGPTPTMPPATIRSATEEFVSTGGAAPDEQEGRSRRISEIA